MSTPKPRYSARHFKALKNYPVRHCQLNTCGKQLTPKVRKDGQLEPYVAFKERVGCNASHSQLAWRERDGTLKELAERKQAVPLPERRLPPIKQPVASPSLRKRILTFFAGERAKRMSAQRIQGSFRDVARGELRAELERMVGEGLLRRHGEGASALYKVA